MQLSEQGIAKLVRAVGQSETLPYALQARIKVIAGCTFARLPEILNRTEHGRYLLNQVFEQGHSFSNLDSELQISAYRCAAVAAEKLLDEENAKQLTQLAEQVSASHVQHKEE